MACDFVCDGCGRRARGQLVGQSSFGTVYSAPSNWKTAKHGNSELHACSVKCVKNTEIDFLAIPVTPGSLAKAVPA